MYIQSKLTETGFIVCSLNLNEVGQVQGNTLSLHENKVIDKGGSHADTESLQLFTTGLGIIMTCFQVHKPITDIVTISGEHVQFSFLFQGKLRVIGNRVEPPLALGEGAIWTSYEKDLRFSVEMCAENEVRHLAIILSKRYFMDLLKNEPWSSNDTFFDKVAKDQFVNLRAEGLLITFHIRRILQDITQNVHQGRNKKHYIELKIRELLFELHAQRSKKLPLNLATQEPVVYEKINEAQAVLTNNFVSPPTVRQLARMVALNELKLKQGFKSVCGSTIHGYIIDLRMKEAFKLLKEEHAVVNEVSAKIGYRSVSHFIYTFKSYYGFTPKQLIKNTPTVKPSF